jgi:hypothetical protein
MIWRVSETVDEGREGYSQEVLLLLYGIRPVCCHDRFRQNQQMDEIVLSLRETNLEGVSHGQWTFFETVRSSGPKEMRRVVASYSHNLPVCDLHGTVIYE